MKKCEYLQKTVWAGLYAGALYLIHSPAMGQLMPPDLGGATPPANHTGAPFTRRGYVLTRGLELGENGKPIWAEIKSDGSFGRTIGEAVEAYANARPMSAEAYRSYKQLLDNFKSNNPALTRGAYILSREEYDARADFGKVEVALANPKPGGPQTESVPIAKPAGSLPEGIHSVLIRAAETIPDPRLLPADTGPVLLQFPVDMRLGTYRTLDDNIKSVLLGEHGEVLETSADNIGYKSGYYSEDDPNREGPPLGPVAGVKVEAGSYTFRGIHGTTDDKGYFYYDVWKPGCPGFSYTINFAHWATLMNRNFDPNAPEFLDFTDARAPDYLVCSGYSAYLNPMGAFGLEGLVKNSLQSTELGTFYGSTYNADINPIFVDVVQFTGQARLSNNGVEMIPVGEPTEYGYVAPDMSRIETPHLDLDADRREDFTILNGDTLSVYLDGVGANAENKTIDAEGNVIDKPDLERRADVAPDFSDQGLLTQISEEDLKKTDLYVYRQSNGQLAVKRHEIDESLIEPTDNQHFWYRLRLPGQSVSNACIGGTIVAGSSIGGACTEDRAEAKAAWQEAQGLAEELRPFQSDHLRPGEQVKIIAINRPTGYIGTVTTTIQPPQNGVQDASIDEIVLRPPNLKVTAERIYTPQSGLTAGQEKRYQIGFEGGALTSDTLVAIHTEWFDHDGTPLPENLEGYTGRMAKVTGPNSLDGGDVATFEIKPGSHLQVVKFQGDILGTEHFYVHVSGFPEWENPGIGAASQGPLQYRPKHYAPIKVTIFDEAATRQARNANAYNRLAGLSGVENVPAVYRYPYRPEMQFSVVDLKQKEMKLQYEEDGVTQTLNLDGADAKTVNDLFNGGHDYVDLLYSLLKGQNDPLESLGPSRDLMFAIGADEMLATFGSNQSLRFDSFEHLADLVVEDYLAIRLYQNNDTENVLWEWAFELGLQGAPIESFISADNPQLDLIAYLPVSDAEVDPNQPPKKVTVTWKVDGPSGALAHTKSESTIGLFTNTLITQRQAGSVYSVIAIVTASEDERFSIGDEFKFGPLTVVPGEPSSIELQGTVTSVQANEVSKVTIDAIVYDAHSPPNRVSDGTPVTWQLDYDGELQLPVTETANGQVSVEYEVGDKLLESAVIAQAGAAEQSFVLAKTPVTANLSVGNTSLPANEVATTTVSVTTNAVDGTPVEWNSTHGRILNAQNEISNGQAVATLISSRIPGEGTLMVSVAEATDSEVIEFTSVGGLGARFEHAAIVAAGAPGSVPVDTLSGTAQHSYINSTNVTISGTPNEELTLEVGGFFTPNAPSRLHLAMDGITVEGFGTQDEQRYVGDLVSGIRATIMGDVEDDLQNGFTQPGSSLAMQGGYLTVAPTSSLEITDDLFVNVRFRTNSDKESQQLVFKGNGGTTAYALTLINGGSTLQATVTTDQGTYSVEAQTPVEQDTWYIAGIRVRNGRLELGLNDERQAVNISGQLLGNGLGLAFGSGFEGNLDDIKIGRESLSDALLVFGDGTLQQSLTLDASGSATLPVRATGNAISTNGNVVGLTARQGLGTAATQAPEQELNFANLAMTALSSLMGVNAAYAQPVAGAQESGLALVSPAKWGAVAEWVGRKVFGDAFDTVKRVAQFVFELTAISDIYVLAKALVSFVRSGSIGDTDAFEITFATIGIGITVLAVFTGGAALPLKFGLIAIKPVLRELFQTGLQDAIKVGILTGKFLFNQIKLFISNPALALRELGDMVVAFEDLILDASGAALRAFFRSVRSLDDLLNWIKSYKLNSRVCILADSRNINAYSNYASVKVSPQGTVQYFVSGAGDVLLEAFFGRMAYAQGCGKVTEKLKEITLNTARYGDDAANIGKQVRKAVNILSDAGILLVNGKSYNVLADIAKNGGPEVIEKFAKNAAKNFENASIYTLRLTGASVDRLLDSLEKIPLTSANYKAWVKVLSSNNSFAIKGILGESEAIGRTISKYGADPSTLILADRVDHSFVNIHGVTVRPNAQGVDAIMELPDGRKLFVESKVRSAATGASRDEVLTNLKNQFFKHVETKIKPLVVQGDDGLQFAEDLVPVLDYQLAGSFYQGLGKSEVLEVFSEILEDPRFADVVKAGFKFDASHIDILELIPPIIN